MKHKLVALILLAVSGASLVFLGCKDEDNVDESKNLSDPRIRSMVTSPASKIVVNDLDAIIFNYDSLDKGTNLSFVRTYFYGYVSQPTIKYLKDGEWVDFKNGSSLDLSDRVEILSTSEDKSQQKRYTIEMRVHNYDVAAFTWQDYASLDLSSRISSQKSFTYGQKNLWFCSDESGACALYSSSDLKTWEKKALSIEGADWSSSAIMGDSIFVQKGNGDLYAAQLDNLQFTACASSVKLEKILFTIKSAIWAIGSDANGRYIYSKSAGDFQKRAALPENFPSEHITTFTSPSGYTSLGYVYASQNGQGAIWSIDGKGNTCQLQKADGSIPSLKNPNVFFYSGMLGIVGGEKEDGSYSTECYSSNNGGVSWQHDWHKDLSGDGLANSGTFVFSDMGEIVFVGGNTPAGVSNKVKKCVLNKLTADDLNYQN